MHALAHEDNHDLGAFLLLVNTQRVPVHETIRHYVLLFDRRGHVSQPVAVEGCKLELERVGGFLHPLFELPLEDIGLSLQEKRHLLDHLPVILSGNLARARAKTLAHRVVEAGSVALDKLFALAKPQGKKLVEIFQRVSGGPRRGVGAEMERPVFLKPPDDIEPGIGIAGVEPDREVVFVVS